MTRSGKYTEVARDRAPADQDGHRARGNGDDEPPPAAAYGFAIHGIVEVLGIFTVDGHQRHLAQILATLPVRRLHLGSKTICGANDLGRKLLR